MLAHPTTIARLPTSALAKGKKVHAGAAQTLALERDDTGRASLRRMQRAEVVLGLPGGGVQVYDVRAPWERSGDAEADTLRNRCAEPAC